MDDKSHDTTRKKWEQTANPALERAGRPERIDHRSLEAQRQSAIERGDDEAADRLDRLPGMHIGPARVSAWAREAEARGTPIGRVRALKELDYLINGRVQAKYRELVEEHKKVQALLAELDEMRAELDASLEAARKIVDGRA